MIYLALLSDYAVAMNCEVYDEDFLALIFSSFHYTDCDDSNLRQQPIDHGTCLSQITAPKQVQMVKNMVEVVEHLTR